VGVLVGQRVQPVVATEHRLGRGDHQLVELADGDGAGLVDLPLGEGGDLRQLRGIVHHLDPHLAARGVAQILQERRPLGLQRLQGVGNQHLVLARRVEEDEVLALRPGVALGDRQGVAGEAEVGARPVLHPRALQRLHCLGVAALAEGHPPGEEVERLISGGGGGAEPLQLGAGGNVVLVVEQLLQRLHPGTGLGRGRAGVGHGPGEDQEGQERSAGHFTSSS
jgi:hypothetical protein